MVNIRIGAGPADPLVPVERERPLTSADQPDRDFGRSEQAATVVQAGRDLGHSERIRSDAWRASMRIVPTSS